MTQHIDAAAKSTLHLLYVCTPLLCDQEATVRRRRDQFPFFQFGLDVPLNHQRVVARGALAEFQKRSFRFGTKFF